MMTTETMKALDELSHADALLALLGEVRDGDLGTDADFGRDLVIDTIRDHLAAAREALSWVHELGRVEAGTELVGGE